jgi:hypothetical protein
MGKLIVVENDRVEGTDTHNVAGIGPNPGAPPPTANFKGTGRFDYKGKMTDQLSDFVNINGKPVALKSRKPEFECRKHFRKDRFDGCFVRRRQDRHVRCTLGPDEFNRDRRKTEFCFLLSVNFNGHDFF